MSFLSEGFNRLKKEAGAVVDKVEKTVDRAVDKVVQVEHKVEHVAVAAVQRTEEVVGQVKDKVEHVIDSANKGAHRVLRQVHDKAQGLVRDGEKTLHKLSDGIVKEVHTVKHGVDTLEKLAAQKLEDLGNGVIKGAHRIDKGAQNIEQRGEKKLHQFADGVVKRVEHIEREVQSGAKHLVNEGERIYRRATGQPEPPGPEKAASQRDSYIGRAERAVEGYVEKKAGQIHDGVVHVSQKGEELLKKLAHAVQDPPPFAPAQPGVTQHPTAAPLEYRTGLEQPARMDHGPASHANGQHASSPVVPAVTAAAKAAAAQRPGDPSIPPSSVAAVETAAAAMRDAGSPWHVKGQTNNGQAVETKAQLQMKNDTIDAAIAYAKIGKTPGFTIQAVGNESARTVAAQNEILHRAVLTNLPDAMKADYAKAQGIQQLPVIQATMKNGVPSATPEELTAKNAKLNVDVALASHGFEPKGNIQPTRRESSGEIASQNNLLHQEVAKALPPEMRAAYVAKHADLAPAVQPVEANLTKTTLIAEATQAAPPVNGTVPSALDTLTVGQSATVGNTARGPEVQQHTQTLQPAALGRG